MTDEELIEWIKQVNPGVDMPTDTGPRITRLIQLLINKAYPDKRKPGRPTLKLNKSA